MVKYGEPAAGPGPAGADGDSDDAVTTLAGGWDPGVREEHCMRGVRGVRVGALLVAFGLMVAACGGGDEGGDTGTGGGTTVEAKKVGLVFDSAGRGDKSFNDSAAAGLDAAKQKLGDQIEVKDLTPNKDGSNRKEILDSLVGDGYQLLLGIGFAFTPDIVASAKENTDVQFAGVDVFDNLCLEKKNLTCLGFKEHEGSFIVGAAAALKTKSNTVGFVGGQEVELIKKFQAGYEAGVDYINETEGKNVKVLVDYAGTTIQAFTDPAKGKELALKQIGQGADVLYHAAGSTGNGVIAEAAANKKYAIGVDSDQSLTASPAEQKWILTSMLKRVDTAVQATIEKFVAGQLTEGSVQSFGVKEGGVDYAQNEFNQELLGDLPTKLDEIKEKIASGEIKVPDKPAS
jgi:basic membrane protein A and related proteins